jgi:stage V sporulation protein R
MNEGWASYWHARLLREANFLPEALYVDAIKTHSDVVRPYATESQLALAVNPYHLGFNLWEKIIEEKGLDQARQIMQLEDDFGFIRNNLDDKLIRKLGLFHYKTRRRQRELTITDVDVDAIKEDLLASKYNFGAPHIQVTELRKDGSLILMHDHVTDRRGLDLDWARKVLEYIHTVWRRPVALYTVNIQGKEVKVTAGE